MDKNSNQAAPARRQVPIAVVVVVTDTCSTIEYRSTGVLFPDGAVLVDYPFRAAGEGNKVVERDGEAFDPSHLILPDGEEMQYGDGLWHEVSKAPQFLPAMRFLGLVPKEEGFDVLTHGGVRFAWNASVQCYLAIDGVPRPLLQSDLPAETRNIDGVNYAPRAQLLEALDLVDTYRQLYEIEKPDERDAKEETADLKIEQRRQNLRTRALGAERGA